MKSAAEKPIEEVSAPETGEDPTAPAGRSISVVGEIVLNMSILMVAAIILIVVLVNWTYAALPEEYLDYAAYILIPYIFLFSLTVALFGWRLISMVIVRPLNVLSDATKAVAAGDLERRVPVIADNEIGRLARSFNDMTERLAEGRRQLEANLAEMQELNEDLAQTQRELLSSEKLASVGRLAAGVAHEIGNPLAAIAGYLDLLTRRSHLQEPDREMLERVRSEADRIHEIIRELLDYSRPQDASRVLIDLNESVHSALTLIACGHKGLDRIEVVTDLQGGSLVLGNRSSLQQLIMNLIINALQAMADGGKLTLSTRPAELEGSPGIELVVADTGPGIAPEIQERVFDPFFTTKEPGQGTGLGLSTCLRIVENMKGKIGIESRSGEGAAFRVWLPAAEAGEV